jgi:hypothetical protein
VDDIFLGISREDGILEEKSAKIQGMFSDPFQKYLSANHLTELVVSTRDSFYRVVPHKVSIGYWDNLEIYFMKYEFFVSLSSMQNGKSLGIDVLSCEFYKEMWDTMK